MIATNGLLEFAKRQRIGNKRFAMREIDVDGVKIETRQIMKAQMRDGRDERRDVVQDVETGMIGTRSSRNVEMQLPNKSVINFATTQHIIWIARHAAAIFAHPLQIMRIVSANLKSPGIPRPKALALGAKHLVAALSLVNKNLAIGAWFSVLLQERNRRKRVGIANMCVIIPGGLEFPAMCTGVLVASGTLPSGRHKAITVGISTAMYELLNILNLVGALSHQLSLCPIQVILECL